MQGKSIGKLAFQLNTRLKLDKDRGHSISKKNERPKVMVTT